MSTLRQAAMVEKLGGGLSRRKVGVGGSSLPKSVSLLFSEEQQQTQNSNPDLPDLAQIA